MLGALDVALKENRGISEGALRLTLRLLKAGFQILGIFDNAHTATATAKGSLDNKREADLFGNLEGFFRIGDRILGSGQGWYLSLVSNFTRLDFITHPRQQFRTRSNKGYTIGFTGIGESRIF